MQMRAISILGTLAKWIVRGRATDSGSCVVELRSAPDSSSPNYILLCPENAIKRVFNPRRISSTVRDRDACTPGNWNMGATSNSKRNKGLSVMLQLEGLRKIICCFLPKGTLSSCASERRNVIYRLGMKLCNLQNRVRKTNYEQRIGIAG